MAAVAALVTVVAIAAPARAAGPIPLGTALWFACTEPTFDGPPSLQCQHPYDPRYLQTFLRGFSRLTPENEFKMAFLEPGENSFDFSVADQIARFAVAHDKAIRGHTLVWDRELPGWLTNPLLPWSHDSLLATMRSYIATVVGHFAAGFPGLVGEWDVINEPLGDDGNLAQNIWESTIGPEYIADALIAAHQADPNAKLVINDEGTDWPSQKSMAMLALAKRLRQQGVPLDTVGFEAHVTPATAPPLGYLLWLMRQYANAGINVEITELDVASDGISDEPAAKQDVFRRYALACHASPNCTGVSVWGVADPYSWLGPLSDALLYDSAFRPRPAVAEFRELLAGHALAAHGRRHVVARRPFRRS